MENLLNDKNKNNCFEVLLSGNTISNNGEDFNAAQLKQEVLKNRMDGLLENKCLSRIFKTLIFFVMMGLISLGRIYGIVIIIKKYYFLLIKIGKA